MMMQGSSRDRLLVLLDQESTIYKTYDYLGAQSVTSTPQTPREARDGVKKRRLLPRDPIDNHAVDDATKKNLTMNSEWRLNMLEWAYKIVDHFDLDREIVFVATNYLDRCLASVAIDGLGKAELQLLAMTCVYLAIKLNEVHAIQICGSKTTMESLLRLARNRFSMNQMKEMEYEVLQRLQWRMHPPTPQIFVEHFAPVCLPTTPFAMRDQALYFIELAALDYFFVEYKPSEIALAASLNAVEAVAPEDLSECWFRLSNAGFDPMAPRILQCQSRLTHLLQESDAALNRASSPVSVTKTISRIDKSFGV